MLHDRATESYAKIMLISGRVAMGNLPVQHVQRRALLHFRPPPRGVSTNRAEDADPLRQDQD